MNTPLPHGDTIAFIEYLMGFVEDGSQETITMGQDDATRLYTVGIRGKSYHGDTLRKALSEAIDDN